MNIKSQSLLSKTVYIIVLAFLVVSCQPTPFPTQPTEGNGIQDIRVQATEPTKTTSKVEQFPLPNCGGSDKLAQSLGTFASVSKSATVGGKATVTGGGEAAIPETVKLKLEIQVELAYQQTFESANSRLDTIVMSAAAGTHVVYTIVWEEQTFDSIVQYSSDGKVYEVPYTYKLSVPKIDKSYNVICDSDNGNVPATQAPVATKSPILNGALPSFDYPVDGQALDYEGAYLFKIIPVNGADGYLWGFFQNNVMVWENLRDEGNLSGVEYGIIDGSIAHSKFSPGYVEVWVRAGINNEFTEPIIITINLKPR